MCAFNATTVANAFTADLLPTHEHVAHSTSDHHYGPAASMIAFAAAGQLAESQTVIFVVVHLSVAFGTGPQAQFNMAGF